MHRFSFRLMGELPIIVYPSDDPLVDTFVDLCWEILRRSVHSDRFEPLRIRICTPEGGVRLRLLLASTVSALGTSDSPLGGELVFSSSPST